MLTIASPADFSSPLPPGQQSVPLARYGGPLFWFFADLRDPKGGHTVPAANLVVPSIKTAGASARAAGLLRQGRSIRQRRTRPTAAAPWPDAQQAAKEPLHPECRSAQCKACRTLDAERGAVSA